MQALPTSQLANEHRAALRTFRYRLFDFPLCGHRRKEYVAQDKRSAGTILEPTFKSRQTGVPQENGEIGRPSGDGVRSPVGAAMVDRPPIGTTNSQRNRALGNRCGAKSTLIW